MTEALRWSDKFLLGYTPMDRTHEEFVACVAALQAATDAELPACLEALAAHCVRHFQQEEQWMTDTLGSRTIEPTGKSFRIRMAASFEFAPGSDKIVCERPYFDTGMVLRALGIA